MKNKGPIRVQTKNQVEQAVGLGNTGLGPKLKPAEVTVAHNE